jgi:branched-chain amino acid transport system substrate-binding protein
MTNWKALVTLFVLATAVADAKPSGEPLRIGHVDALTGADAAYGVAVDRGIQMAVEEVNEAGGVKGRPIELISLDDQGKSQEAVLAATKLISLNKVVALLGESTSSKALAMAPIAQKNKIPMISPWATNEKVTQVGDYIFRVCYIDAFQGTVLAKFVFEKLKLKRVAILRDLNSDASLGLADYFSKKFTELGGQVVANEVYTAGDVDFRSQLVAVREKKAEAVFLTGYYMEAGLIARQARELGIKAPFLGGDAWDAPELLKLGGKDVEGSYFSTHYSAESTQPEVKAFVSRFKAKYKEVPSAPAALGYDAAKILVAAMNKAQSFETVAIRDALAKTAGFAGVTGKIAINENRDAVKPTVIMKVKNGKFTYEATIAP